MTDQQAPERIWFYADPIAGWLGSAKSFTTPDGVSPKPYVPLDLLEVAEKKRDELAAENARLSKAVEFWTSNHEKRWVTEKVRADKAEAEIDRLREALKPFAKSADGRRRKDMMGAVCFGQNVLLAARNALQLKEGNE